MSSLDYSSESYLEWLYSQQQAEADWLALSQDERDAISQEVRMYDITRYAQGMQYRMSIFAGYVPF